MNLFHLMSPLLVLFTILAAFYTYLLVKVPNKYMLKWVGIPLLLIGSYFSYIEYGQSLGYAVPNIPDGQFVYIAHHPINRELVELWVIEKNGRSRVYSLPWSKLLEDKLLGAQTKAAKGIVQIGKLRLKRGKGEWDWDNSDFGDMPMEQEYPKGPIK